METKKAELLPASQALSTTTRHELTGTVTQENNETAQTAISTKIRAEIESSLVLARKFPRDENNVRIGVLKTCRIPSFAEKAKYKKPQGKTQDEKGKWVQNYVIGPSIRLAEELFRQWGNITFESAVLYEDGKRRIVAVRAMDLQTLATTSAQFIVEKTVERKDGKYREIISERMNSKNEKVCIVVATEDEVLSKQNNMMSKYRRNLIIQLIPTYILQDAIEIIDEVVLSGIKEDPEKSKKTIMDNFAKIGVLPSDLEKYLNHPLTQIIPSEIAELKDLHMAIAERETTWVEAMEEKINPEGETKKPVETGSAGFIPPAQLEGESAWDYDTRVEQAELDFNKKGFKAGDATTHSHVGDPLKKNK